MPAVAATDWVRAVPSALGTRWGRTAAPRDALTAPRIRAGLRTRVVGSTVVSLRRASSTNDVALHLAARGCPDGLVVAAEAQWAGRGRLQRAWHSPAGAGIWCSIVLRPECTVAEAQALTFLGAVAAARAIRALHDLPVALKWPNDLVLGALKLGGVLAELEAEGTVIRHAVVGIGLNVNLAQSEFPAPLRATATSVRATLGARVDRAALLCRVLEELDRRYAVLRSEGPGSLVAEAGGLMPMAGSIIRARDHARVLEGTVTGLDDDGALLVRLLSGSVVRLNAGEVTILR
ncbi:MAG: biotin--[acetyl-CoA-carboxylase] ligase [Candidatus Coatesbacteria bacterium]